MKLKKILFKLFFITIIFINHKSYGLENSLTVGLYHKAAPFAYINKKGEAKGFDVDIANAICLELKTPCKIKKLDRFSIDDYKNQLNQNKVDFIVSGVTITKQREKLFDFTNKYYSSSVSFAIKKDQKIYNLKGLHGKTIGVIPTTLGGKKAIKTLKFNAYFMNFDTTEEMLDALLSGQIDAAVQDTVMLWGFAAKEKNIKILETPINTRKKIGIIVKKGRIILKKRINSALENIIKSGKYRKINKKYFPFSIY